MNRWKAQLVGVGDPQENRRAWMVTQGGKVVADCRRGTKAAQRVAHIIAAAPELYEVCTAMLVCMDANDGGSLANAANDARAVLAKVVAP